MKHLILSLALLGLLSGCSSKKVDVASIPVQNNGPRGGVAAPIPGKGYAEILVERGAGAAGVGKDILAVYLLNEDLTTPMASIPDSLIVDLESAEGAMPGISLAVDPAAKESARFASKPGDYGFDIAEGTLKATIDGEAVEVDFLLR